MDIFMRHMDIFMRRRHASRQSILFFLLFDRSPVLTGESYWQQQSPGAEETSQSPSHVTPTLAECTGYSCDFVPDSGAKTNTTCTRKRARGSGSQDGRPALATVSSSACFQAREGARRRWWTRAARDASILISFEGTR